MTGRQNGRTQVYLSQLHYRDGLAQQLQQIASEQSASFSALEWRKGRIFAMRFKPPAQQPVLVRLASLEPPALWRPRFPYASPIREETLRQVEEAENLLRLELGFREVRVRYHGPVARIEVVPEEFARLLSEPVREQVVDRLRTLGFSFVCMDLEGFRSGRMNEALEKKWRNSAEDQSTQ